MEAKNITVKFDKKEHAVLRKVMDIDGTTTQSFSIKNALIRRLEYDNRNTILEKKIDEIREILLLKSK